MCQKPANRTVSQANGERVNVIYGADAVTLSDALGNTIVLDDITALMALGEDFPRYAAWRQEWERLPGEKDADTPAQEGKDG